MSTNDETKDTIFLSKELNDENQLLERKRLELEELERSKKESEENIRQAYDDLLTKNKELLNKTDELSKFLTSSLSDENKKIKLNKAQYGVGKLLHNMYSDTKSVLKVGIFGLIFISILTSGGNDLSEKDGILENLINEDVMYDLALSDDYINNDLVFDLNRLTELNKDVEKVLEKGYARESDEYLKSIYIKSKIVKEGRESLGEDTVEINKLIKDLETKLEIGE